MSDQVEVRLPELAEAMTSATLAAWLKEPGDPVTAGEPIAEVETDKTTVELEAPADGVLADIRVAAGTRDVAVGALLAVVLEDARAGGNGPIAESAPPFVEVRLPELADAMTSATLTAWLKEPGDPVTAGEPIAEVETDKTTVELEAPAGGVLAEIRIPAGAQAVAVGTLLALVREGATGRTGTAARTTETVSASGTTAPAPASGAVDSDAPEAGAVDRPGCCRGSPDLVCRGGAGGRDASSGHGCARHAAGAADGRARRAGHPRRRRFRPRRPGDEGGRGAPAPVDPRTHDGAGSACRGGRRTGRSHGAVRGAGVGPSPFGSPADRDAPRHRAAHGRGEAIGSALLPGDRVRRRSAAGPARRSGCRRRRRRGRPAMQACRR